MEIKDLETKEVENKSSEDKFFEVLDNHLDMVNEAQEEEKVNAKAEAYVKVRISDREAYTNDYVLQLTEQLKHSNNEIASIKRTVIDLDWRINDMSNMAVNICKNIDK